jgi:aerobic-type carbon monoxide dehydrogenase small subunit (CoxS/CutS family)
MMEATFRINGKDRTISFGSRSTLLEVLRAHGYTEVKEGCREGQCGSCVVFLNGKLVNSCQVLAASAAGKDILTVKGIGDVHSPHPIQRAFAETGAIQCGFCTPGMILAAYALLSKNPDPDEGTIKRALDGNLCRCTGYVKIVEAVRLAARRMRENE